jgi:hypothetical protein
VKTELLKHPTLGIRLDLVRSRFEETAQEVQIDELRDSK